jgi:small-conductance mechanosensitive channel
LNTGTENLVEGERAALRAKIAELQKRIDDTDNVLEKRRLEILQQQKKLEDEAEGKSGTGAAGRGPAWRDKKDNLERLEKELERDRAAMAGKNQLVLDEQKEAKTALAALDARLAADKQSNVKVARHLDGLMKRIQISHEIGGLIPFAIMLLLLCIEAGPIFFKLMIIKGAYDYLDENQKRIVRARAGIEPDARVVSDGHGKSIHVDIHHGVNAILDETRRRLETERALSAEVHEAFKKKVAAEIQNDPSRFVKPG